MLVNKYIKILLKIFEKIQNISKARRFPTKKRAVFVKIRRHPANFTLFDRSYIMRWLIFLYLCANIYL